jgi:hypothetical protein
MPRPSQLCACSRPPHAPSADNVRSGGGSSQPPSPSCVLRGRFSISLPGGRPSRGVKEVGFEIRAELRCTACRLRPCRGCAGTHGRRGDDRSELHTRAARASTQGACYTPRADCTLRTAGSLPLPGRRRPPGVGLARVARQVVERRPGLHHAKAGVDVPTLGAQVPGGSLQRGAHLRRRPAALRVRQLPARYAGAAHALALQASGLKEPMPRCASCPSRGPVPRRWCTWGKPTRRCLPRLPLLAWPCLSQTCTWPGVVQHIMSSSSAHDVQYSRSRAQPVQGAAGYRAQPRFRCRAHPGRIQGAAQHTWQPPPPHAHSPVGRRLEAVLRTQGGGHLGAPV